MQAMHTKSLADALCIFHKILFHAPCSFSPPAALNFLYKCSFTLFFSFLQIHQLLNLLLLPLNIEKSFLKTSSDRYAKTFLTYTSRHCISRYCSQWQTSLHYSLPLRKTCPDYFNNHFLLFYCHFVIARQA